MLYIQTGVELHWNFPLDFKNKQQPSWLLMICSFCS